MTWAAPPYGVEHMRRLMEDALNTLPGNGGVVRDRLQEMVTFNADIAALLRDFLPRHQPPGS